MDYKLIIDKLESVIPQHNNHKWWIIELSEHYIEGETVNVINLHNTGNGNEYRLYHSELDDRVKTDKELLKCCLENLQEIYGEIRSVMGSLLDSGYVMLGEMCKF